MSERKIPGDDPWEDIFVRVMRAAGFVDLVQGDAHLTVDRKQAPALIEVLQALLIEPVEGEREP